MAWSIAPVLITYTSVEVPILFSTFLRYLVSLLILWPWYFSVVGAAQRKQIAAALPRLLPRFAAMAVFNLLFQLCYTGALYLILPGMALMVYQTGAIFAIALSALLFADERTTLKRPAFHAGLFAAFFGVLLVIRGGVELGNKTSVWGVVLIVLAALWWTLLSVAIKRLVPDYAMPISTPAVLSMVMVVLLLGHLVLSGGSTLPRAPLSVWLWLLLSGVLGIGVGHSLYYRAMPILGVALSSSRQLVRPLLTSIISALFLGEFFTPWQVVGGVLLIAGSYVVTVLRFRDIPAGNR